jgi:hypothetical protein
MRSIFLSQWVSDEFQKLSGLNGLIWQRRGSRK